MISCTEFIPMYSELFKYLHKLNGKKEVEKYWEYVSDKYVEPLLGKEIDKFGLQGCWEYWSKSLNEEACDFYMSFDEGEGIFTNVMHGCPSKGMLNRLGYTNPYPDYCEHCEILYKKVVEKRGFTYKKDYSQVAEAKCDCIITDPKICTCDNLNIRLKIDAYIKKLNLSQMPLGQHLLKDGDFVNIVEYETKELSDLIFERHNKYIDGFYMISGAEKILTAKKNSEITSEYDEEKDCELAKCEDYNVRVLEEGCVTVIDTKTYHCPSLAVDNSKKVRKAIFKIEVN